MAYAIYRNVVLVKHEQTGNDRLRKLLNNDLINFGFEVHDVGMPG